MLPRGFDKRDGKRASIARPIEVVTHDGRFVDAVLQDISSEGFRIQSDEYMLPGDKITLLDGGERFHGIVKWGIGHEAGGLFLSPIDLAKFN